MAKDTGEKVNNGTEAAENSEATRAKKEKKFKNPFAKKRHITEEEDIYRDRYVSAPKKQKKKHGKIFKLMLGLVAAAVLAVGIWFVYYLIHYRFYDGYKQYLTSYEYEEGMPFQAIAESTPSVAGMELVAENDILKLYTNRSTAEVAVYDKRSGVTTYSNPVDRADDPKANDVNKKYLSSQLLLDYYNSAGVAATFDSYTDSVSKGQFEVKSINGGVRYVYRFGDMSNATGIVPTYMTSDTLNRVADTLSDTDRTTLLGYYLSGSSKSIVQMNPVALRNPAVIEQLNVWFEAAGFTADDYINEMTAAGQDKLLTPSFTVELDYRLEGDGLKVSVPVCSLIEGGGAKIYRIQLLRFFAAAGKEENGYILVPNGSGSLIYFNNGRTAAADYSQYIYGMDLMSQTYTLLENTEPARLPVFGMEKEDATIFAVMGEGSTLSMVTASISGKVNSYNSVYNSFIIRGYEQLKMFGVTGDSSDMPIVEQQPYDFNLTMTYHFLDDEHRGYSGMANYYRELLISQGALTDRVSDTELPFYYDVIGGVKKTTHFMGVRYRTLYPMTDFEQAGRISDDLLARGISNQVMNYQGWMNGGYYHDAVNRIWVPLRLGGETGLETLSTHVTNNGGRFYADVALQKVTYISKHYNPSMVASRYYGSGYIAEFGKVNPSTLRQTSGLGYSENLYSLLSPKFLNRYVDCFVSNMQTMDIAGISLRDLGDELHSDRRRTELIDREQSLNIVLAQFDAIAGLNRNIMVSGGNMYSFAYADDIINAPVQDNNFFVIDADVPFYEMVIHGYIDYSTELLNLESSRDMDRDVLSMIEYGAAPHYVFTWESATEMRYTGLNNYYATQYGNWADEAVSIYEKVSEVLNQVEGATIVSHEIIDENVRKVCYDNGRVIYINYGDTEQTVEGITVSAKGYAVQ